MMHNKITAVCKKELASYFTSPVAFMFLGVFLVVSMFVFFWVENFFARNIADVRPLFEWMPLLLIFLVAALTMRMWSDERRVGTIEFLLTAPVKTHHLVLGKFFACMTLVIIALLLTLVLPISVSFLGDLDWGPVFGAYLGAILVAAAYTSIGLFVSSKSDNQIVSLIGTIVICFVFFLIGSDAIASLVGNRLTELFSLLGIGSRFQSIERGVIDFRDLYYYLSLIGVFLTLNVLGLESFRWSKEVQRSTHSRVRWLCLLLILNFLAANFWLHKTYILRTDLTKGSVYTISDATKGIIEQLQEPLLIRGYFSAKTHPELAPLVPQIRDLIEEFSVVAGGRVRSEFIDPRENPDLEEEANRKFNIKPIPFQIAGKYEAALVNSYFDVLIKYGDKFEVLSFHDLIEIKVSPQGKLDVRLRNLEYDITRSIKKVLYGFQSIDSLFTGMKKPVEFVGYFSADAILPANLAKFAKELKEVLAEMKQISNDKFKTVFLEPEADGGKVAKQIAEQYRFRPMAANLEDMLDAKHFYFYMTLSNSEKIVQVPLPENLNKEGIKRSIEAALKRFSSGFMKTVGLYLPPVPQQNPYMQQMMGPQGRQFNVLMQKLRQDHVVKQIDFKKGIVPEDIDVLFVAAPEALEQKQLFAIDQFLMRGGTVALATSPFGVERNRTGLNVKEHKSGVEDWLRHHGVSFIEKFVMDKRCDAYPIPKRRQAAGFTIEEIVLKEYPYFVSVRDDGMNTESGILTGLPQLTLNWPSPVNVDADKNKERKVVPLLWSSDQAWLSSSKMVEPNYDVSKRFGFLPEGERKKQKLAVMIEGVFESYFKGKDSPLLEKAKESESKAEEAGQSKPEDKKDGEDKKDEKDPVISDAREQSPESARIIVFASNEFLTDQVLRMSASVGGTQAVNAVQLVENTVDWSLEDRILLSIRGRGHFSKTMRGMTKQEKFFWEYLFNYGVSLLGLAAIFVFYSLYRSTQKARFKKLLNA